MTSTVEDGRFIDPLFEEEHLATVTRLIPLPASPDADEVKTAIVTTLQARAS